jgi:FixJ family two-component response regulator
MAQRRVHLVDDDASVLRGVGWLLESAGFDVETYGSGKEFLGRYEVGDAPECVVLDLRMPELSGLDSFVQFGERGWSIPVIFLTGHGTVPDAVSALKHGAFDFIEKPFADDALIACVQKALDRDREMRHGVAAAAAVSARIASLTKREREVATRVAAGLSNKVVAQELGISARTVEVYRAKAMTKTGARSVADLVRMMVRQEATDPGGAA